MPINEAITRYILDEILLGSRSELDPDESLISTGVLDSLTWLQLVAYLEEKFDVTIDEYDLIPDNFQSVNAMRMLLVAKQVPD